MDTQENKNDFTEGSIAAVILRMAAPMTVAQLVSVLYSIVDRMYLGHLEGMGTMALTGLGIGMPLIVIINAFANLCGMGGAPLCSIDRGAGRIAEAEKLMANSLTLLLAFGVALTAVTQIFLRPLLYAFGASDQTYGYAAEYMRIYCVGCIPVMLGLGMHSFINAQGFAKMSMLTTIFGAAVNIVLDPIFIFALGLGIRGAALASVLAQTASAVWVMRFLCSRRAVLTLRRADMAPDIKLCGRILAMGASTFVMNCTASLIQIVANVQLRLYGGDLYVGVMTVVNSIEQVFFLVMNGLNQGAQPVMGYNYGAHRHDRLRQGMHFMWKTWVGYATAVTVIILVFPRPFALMFSSDEELVTLAAHSIRLFFCTFMFMGLQSVSQCLFQSFGRSGKAIFFSLLRKAIIVVPLTVLLPRWGFGVDGVFLANAVSCVLGGTACFVTMYFTEYRRLEKC